MLSHSEILNEHSVAIPVRNNVVYMGLSDARPETQKGAESTQDTARSFGVSNGAGPLRRYEDQTL